MGRFEKSILLKNGIDRRELGYYSTQAFISAFMTKAMLDINPGGTTALDPCVGKEELVKDLYNNHVDVDGIDIFDHGDHYYCHFQQKDFIDFYKEQKTSLLPGQAMNWKYDYYIANPPYNCHEVDYIRNNKNELNELFPNVGVHNMYSMFISAVIDCAKEGALIAMITADGFLTARMHNPLRKQIIDSCAIHHLLLCPTDLFCEQKADVRTCILILQKGKKNQQPVKTLNRPKNSGELKSKLEAGDFIETPIENVVSSSGDNQFEFVVGIPSEIQSLFSLPRIGEKYKCITGVSTGDDSKYLSRKRKAGFEVPFYKNPGSRKFFCEPDGFLTSDYLTYEKAVKNFIVRNKGFMLKEGITCSSMGIPFGACYLPAGSVFGVNANIFCGKADIWWLLGYLNSSLVTYIVRAVLIRSNMISSGYVSKIPVVDLSDGTKGNLHSVVSDAFNRRASGQDLLPVIAAIDALIFNELELSAATEKEVLHFAANLQSRV